jgi:hypothetical protein
VDDADLFQVSYFTGLLADLDWAQGNRLGLKDLAAKGIQTPGASSGSVRKAPKWRFW